VALSADLESSASRHPRTAIVFQTHVFDSEMVARFDNLLDEASKARNAPDVHLLVETDTRIPESHEPVATRFDFHEYSAGFQNLVSNSIVPGNKHLAALFFLDRHPDYDHYWFIEYDVVYTGNWADFLDEFGDDQTDLLATHIRDVSEHPDWYWTDSFDCGNDDASGISRIAAFGPICRISARALSTVREACQRGWSGHFEILLPTAVAHAGLTISEIGGNGRWTPATRLNRHYLAPGTIDLYDSVGTMRHRPVILRPLFPRMLHHPVKAKGEGRVYECWRALRRGFRNAPLEMTRFLWKALRLYVVRSILRS